MLLGRSDTKFTPLAIDYLTILTAMHAIVCCVIALVLLDAVVAINMYVVSKATPAIPARNRENEF
ncbi:hypothetical protein Plhal703r1_c07g0039071 [Plasmopara halstedii]